MNQHATGQRTLEDLSRAEMDALTSLNLIDAQVYGHAMGKFFRLGACLGISIQVTSMDDQSVQVASIRPQCSFAPIPAA